MAIARAGLHMRGKRHIQEGGSRLKNAIGKKRKIQNIHPRCRQSQDGLKQSQREEARPSWQVRGVDPVLSPAEKCMQGKWVLYRGSVSSLSGAIRMLS